MKKFLGPALALLLLGGVVFGIVFSARDKQASERGAQDAANAAVASGAAASGKTTIRILTGSEKLDFLRDPELARVLDAEGIVAAVNACGVVVTVEEHNILGGLGGAVAEVCMEHGAADTGLVAEVCATGRRMNFPVLIRPRSNDYSAIRLAADLGPCGFLLASVESSDDLDIVWDALRVPPRGRRRAGWIG